MCLLINIYTIRILGYKNEEEKSLTCKIYLRSFTRKDI